MFKDTYDLDVTCASDAALQAYLTGLEFSLQFDQPAINEFREAISLDDDFALAHAALGRQLFVHGQGATAKEHLQKALKLANLVTSREQSAIKAIAAAACFEPEALATVLAHVADYPQDVFVLAHLLGPFGMLAFSGSPDWHAQNVALLKETQSFYRDDDWWHLAERSFFHAEQRQLEASRSCGERAWLISENGNTAHSLAHLHFEAGALEEGKSFISEWLAKFGTTSNMRHHLVWHDSLLSMELGVDYHEMFGLYERELDPGVSEATPLEILADNASFLWRCHLSGIDIPLATCEELHGFAESSFGHIGFAFADIHRAMAAALLTRHGRHDDFTERLSQVSSSSAETVVHCSYEYALGCSAFCSEDYAGAVKTLEPVLAKSVNVGGSNPQRRIIEDTYVEACIRAGLNKKAREVLETRNRTFSKSDQQLMKRLNG